jgi:hypothetical protein
MIDSINSHGISVNGDRAAMLRIAEGA